MKNFNYKEKTLAKVIAAILSGTSAFAMIAPLQAAEETQTKEEITTESAIAKKTIESPKVKEAEQNEEIEVVEVTGIRFSQMSALNRKKSGGTMMDSLVAEDIGQFPDKNVAEALQRIPGIQLGRDFGEGKSVSIRGVEPSLVKVEVNSVSALGFDGDRGVDFRDMASELIKSLDVIKGSEARLTEGGIGGTIQVETRKPNEFEENFLFVSGEGQYNDLIGNVSPKFNLTGVYKATEDLGFLFNATASDKSTMIHALRNTEWDRYGDYDNSPDKTSVHPDYASITDVNDCTSAADPTVCQEQWYDFSPVTPRYGIWGRDEKRLSANAIVQYKLTEELSVYAGYTYNTRDKQALDLNLDLSVGSTARFDEDSVIVDENHNVRYFETDNASVTNRTLEFAWDQTTTLLDAGFTFVRDAWRVEGKISQSTSEQDIDSRDTQTTANGIKGIDVTLNADGAPEWNYSDGYLINPEDATDTSTAFNVNDPTHYRQRVRYKYSPHYDESEEIMAKLDISYIPDSDFFTLLRGGYRSSSLSVINENYEYNIIRDPGTDYNGVEWTLADNARVVSGRTFLSPELFSGYNLGVNTVGQYWAVNSKPFQEAMQEIADENVTRRDLDVRTGFYDQVVNTDSLYLQADFETTLFDLPLTGNFGVRYVATEIGANGNVVENIYVDEFDDLENVKLDPITGDYRTGVDDPDHPDRYEGRKTVVEEYSDVLPSINLNLGLIPDELFLYAGAAKVLSHPKTEDLNVNATCKIFKTLKAANTDESPNTCTAGNPALDPYMAEQWEVALNYYPNESSILGASYFVKNITSWIIDAEERYDVDFFGDGRLWDVTQKINGTGVKNTGIEIQASTIFDFLPAPFNNLGANVNYTHMESDNVGLFNQLTGEELSFPSMSEHAYNIGAFYQSDHWTARIAYNYRGEYLAKSQDKSGNPVFVDDAGYMDAKLIYTFDNGIKIFIDGRNLLGEVKVETAGQGRLSDLRWSGREYSIGISYKM